VAVFAGLGVQGLTDTIFFRPEVQLVALFSLATLAASVRGVGASLRTAPADAGEQAAAQVRPNTDG
jgi:putative inorganic carbon (HCO3(-)) transporter